MQMVIFWVISLVLGNCFVKIQMRRLVYILLSIAFSLQSYAVDFHGKHVYYTLTGEKVSHTKEDK